MIPTGRMATLIRDLTDARHVAASQERADKERAASRVRRTRKRVGKTAVVGVALISLGVPAMAAEYQDSVEQGTAPPQATKVIERELGAQPNGEWGDKLTQALKEFQDEQGIRSDGVAGRQTVTALRHRGEEAEPGAIGTQQAQWLGLPKLQPVETVEAAPVEEEAVAPEAAPEPVAPEGAATEGGGGAGGSLAAIRECESGGDYSTNTGNGYYGAYQFTQETWEGVGGTGNPAAASPAEQDARAQQLLDESGTSPWPVCGQ